MHVLSKPMLRAFWELHPDAEGPLTAWYNEARAADWQTTADISAAYGRRATQVGKYTVFNVGGNKFRLAVVVHFDRGKVYIRHVMTHAEYDEGVWKEDA